MLSDEKLAAMFEGVERARMKKDSPILKDFAEVVHAHRQALAKIEELQRGQRVAIGQSISKEKHLYAMAEDRDKWKALAEVHEGEPLSVSSKDVKAVPCPIERLKAYVRELQDSGAYCEGVRDDLFEKIDEIRGESTPRVPSSPCYNCTRARAVLRAILSCTVHTSEEGIGEVVTARFTPSTRTQARDLLKDLETALGTGTGTDETESQKQGGQ